MYNWKYGDKITVSVNENTTIDDLREINETIESQPKTFLSVVAKINEYLCFIWLLFGSFSTIKEAYYFKLLLSVVVCFYGFTIALGIIIGYQSITNHPPHISSSLEDKETKPFPLCYMIEVTKIIIVLLILVKHFIY
jgi:hypothetical protein